jgi:hypothetical protein
VRLHWAEISPSVTGAGGRLFQVIFNGTQVLTSFDIYAAAGAKFKAVTRQFTVAANGSGQIVLQFTRGSQNEAKIGGIEITVPPPRFSSITAAPGATTLTWQTFPGKSYRVEYKNDLNHSGWSILESDLAATGLSLSVTASTTNAPRRFYRIRQLN